jgi:basic amino acid/polyamine antiporter, APA family
MSIQPKLRLFDATMTVVSLVIGVGIFRLPAMVAQNTGSAGLFFLAWILGGVIAMIGAMVFAEIGARRQVAGGYYKIVAEEYHPVLGFVMNWVNLFNELAAYGFVAIVAAEYILRTRNVMMATDSFEIKEIASAIVLVLSLINYFGIRAGASVLNFITVIKIGTILFFALLGIITLHHSVTTTISPSNIQNNFSWLTALGTGFIAVFFSYGGYQNIMNSGADIQNPKRNLPLAIFLGIGIVVILYVSINFGYYHVLGFEGIAQSPLVAADFAQALLGNTGQIIISLAIFISAIGYLGATLIHLPRNVFAMSKDKILPPFFSRVNPRTQVQETTLIVMTIIIIIIIFYSGTLEQFTDFLITNDTLAIAVAASTLWRMRRKITKTDGFQLPFYPLLLILFVGVLLFVSYHSFIQNITGGFISVGLFLSAVPIYFLFKWINRSLA